MINKEENNIIVKRRVLNNIKIIPWFIGLSDDLIFYIGINTLFFTIVKHFNTFQISLFTTIPCLFYILFQKLFLKIIKKIGNINSVRLGAFSLLVSSIIITFAQSFYIIMIGQILYTISFLFKSMQNIILENNLNYLNREDEYIKYKNKASIIYSTATTIVILLSGYLFKTNNFLPMYLGIILCLINLIISFIITDINIDLNRDGKIEEKKKVKFDKLILLIMIAYGVFFAIIGRGQENTKLIIQYELQNYFDVGVTAIYFSYILTLSRIFRMLSNIVFHRIYKKLKDKIGYYLPILCSSAFLLVLMGIVIPTLSIKFILMCIGFCIILGIRDVFDTYMYDLLLKNTKHDQQQDAISYLGVSRKILETILSFIISLMLLKAHLIYIIVVLCVLVLISFFINFKLYKMLTYKNKS